MCQKENTSKVESTEDAWKEHFRLMKKLEEVNKPKKATPIKLLHNPSELGERVHQMCQMMDGLFKMIDELRAKADTASFILESADYVVDHGNVGGKRNRLSFPHDFFGAKQYFDYIKDKYDWAEMLMSVNIAYNEKFIEHKRKLKKLADMEKQNEQLNSDNYEKA